MIQKYYFRLLFNDIWFELIISIRITSVPGQWSSDNFNFAVNFIP